MLRRMASGAHILALLYAGKIPSQVVRRAIYRHVGRMSLGKGSWVYGGAEIRAPWNIRIGEGSIVGFRSTLDGRGGIEIGSDVNLSSEVAIWTRDHDLKTFEPVDGAVRIGNRAWVSSRVTILAGCTVGEGAVVASGAVVTSDVAPFDIVAGIPARTIGKRPIPDSYSLGKPLFFV